MFENLAQRLGGVFDRLNKQGALSEADVATALREVRVALLEADVSLDVARDFVARVQSAATGQAVTKSVTPGQQVTAEGIRPRRADTSELACVKRKMLSTKSSTS